MKIAPLAIEPLAPAAPLFTAETGIYNGVIIREWGKDIVSMVTPSQWADLRDAKADFSDDQDPWLDDDEDDDG